MRQLKSTVLLIATVATTGLSPALACELNQKTYVHEDLTLCWAAWDPANALIELSKDFTAKTGSKMHFELHPWSSFGHSSGEPRAACDLLIGDTQWIGGSAVYGHYVKLNAFLAKEGLSLDGFLPATVREYSTWPKGSNNYYAVPAFGDALGWTYRKDWFAKPEIRSAFKKEHGRELAPPKTWSELLEIAKFFQGREIDGQKRHGVAIYTERGSEGITIGATAALYAFGFKYENTPGKHDMDGAVNSDNAVKGLELYKALYKCCTPPGHSNAYMVENLNAFASGQVAMQMNWFAFNPSILRDEKVGKVSGFFANPGQNHAASVLGGQGISVVKHSDKTDKALQYIKWFIQPDVQKRWQALGGYSTHKAVLEDPAFPTSSPFATEYLEAMKGARDFWQEPTYQELLLFMQQRLHDYVVADKGTAKEALDRLARDWKMTFREDRKIP